MTSFIIDEHKTRKAPPSWKPGASDCAFCEIIKENTPAHKVYEDEKTIVILDVLPIRRGHVLVIPKIHIPRLSDLPPEYAEAAGKVISKIAKALTEALDSTGLNVVCNQEYAQAVPHVHFHIVPAPTFEMAETATTATTQSPSLKEMHRREYLAREELDEEEAEAMAQKIQSKL